MWPNPQETADLITLTEETLNGELHENPLLIEFNIHRNIYKN